MMRKSLIFYKRLGNKKLPRNHLKRLDTHHIKDDKESTIVNYDIDTYLTDPDEPGFWGDVDGSSHIPDDKLVPKIGTAMTLAPTSIVKRRIIVEDLPEPNEDVPISPFPQEAGMEVQLRLEPQVESDHTMAAEKLVEPEVKATAVDDEPVIVVTMTALAVLPSKPLVMTTLVSSTLIDVSSILASLASYFMPGENQLPTTSTASPVMTKALAMVTEAGPSRYAKTSLSPDSNDSAEWEIKF